jgi:peptidoglycan hydrolase-like protein with peptidoglycan-binding domain
MATQKEISTLQLQKKLIDLYNEGVIRTQVIADGIYNDLTRRAVEEIQAIKGLPITGVTNFATWQVIIRGDYK